MKKYGLPSASLCAVVLVLAFFLCAMGGKPQKDAAPRPAAAAQPVSDAPSAPADPPGDAPKTTDAGEENELPAAVTSISIVDREALEKNKPIVVTFSEPMIGETGLNVPVAVSDMPFVIKPAVAGEGRWVTDQSFAFAAEQGFLPGKQYALLFKDSLRSLQGRPVRYFFSFKTEAPKLKQVQPGSYDPAHFRQTLHLDFSLPVSLLSLAEHLAITDADSGEVLDLDLSLSPEAGGMMTVIAELGKFRPQLNLVLREDRDGDKYPLGFSEPYKVSLRLPGETGVAKVVASGDTPSPLSFYNAYGYEDEQGHLVARFTLSEYLSPQAEREFIEVSPDVPYSLNAYGDTFVFSDKLEPGMRLTVTLKPGLTDAAGRVLKEERSASLTVQDYEPAARVAEPGNFLTPLFGSRVALNLVNVDQVTVSLQRQYDNNLPFMSLEPEYFAKKMMREIAFKETTVRDLKRNDIQRRALDLEDLANGRRGVFLLTLRGYWKDTDEEGRPYMRYGNQDERLVVLTDIGITARAFPSGITVFATSLSTAKPLSDAEVKVFSASNQLIARGHTGPDGVFIHKRGEAWDSQLAPAIVTVRHGAEGEADLTFLPLNHETGIFQEDPALRPYLDSGYEAFLYTPRGVFRPGETVDIKAFVRNPDHNPPAPFPVLFRVLSARGLEAARGSVMLSEEGGADFAFTLPASAPTGDYRAVLEIPGQKNRNIGACDFSVEDFVPPRLEVQVKPTEDRLLQGQALEVDLSGQYLFGAPGAKLPFELGYRVRNKGFSPEGFSGYIFGDGERRFDPQVNLRYITGALDDKGTGNVAFKAPADWTPPALLEALLIASVQEDGGRWVSQTGSFTYFPTPYLLGLKLENAALAPNEAAIVSIVAVGPDGAPQECGPLSAEISLVQGNWHTVYRNGRYVYTWDERLAPQEKQILDSQEGRAEVRFTPKQYGTYLVRVAAHDGTIVGSRRFTAQAGEGHAGLEGSGRMDAVEMSFDKADYLPGETARLSVRAPYAGTLFLGLERGAQLSTRVMVMEQPATVVDIPVTGGMDPNISVTAWVIRPVREENREWYAHRAHGKIALMLSREPHTLKVSARTPKRAAPSAPLAVPFTVTDEQGTPVEGEFSVALIDEGILSLTGFVTPEPVAFFMARRSAVGNSYDAFDALLRPEARATPLLRPGGGAAAAYHGSLSTQQVFLTAYQPVVRTDANGQGEALFDIPEYSGKGRLMIVGASGNRFASAEANVRFARDIVVEATAPRAVAPGDSFEVTLQLFTVPEEGEAPPQGAANIKVSAEGPLALAGDVETSLPLAPENGDTGPVAHSLSVTGTAAQASGVAAITVRVEVPDRPDLSFAKTLEVAVRPPYPRTSASAQDLIKAGESKELRVPGTWLAGDVGMAFSLDKSPVLAILPALEFLREYPYGCLEQVTSRAWPYLTLSTVQQALHPEQDADPETVAKTGLNRAVSSIASLQTADGGFSMWPGQAASDMWRSVNAAFFLIEAKSRVPVAPATMERALAFLRLTLSSPPAKLEDEAYAYSTKAFAAFVLTRAGEAPLSWLQHLSEQEERMLPSGRIFLAGAKALKAGNPAALKALSGHLPDLAKLELGLNPTMESEMRNRSLLLFLWSQVAPNDPETVDLCLDLAGRLGASRWFSTQDSGMAALALGAYLEKTGGGGEPFAADISAPGVESAHVESGDPVVLTARDTPLEADGTVPPVTVQVSKGSGYAVYNVRGTPLEPPAPASSGIRISRTWKDADGEVIDLSSGTATLRKGDRVLVELTVTPARPVSDIALSDLLPGGMEVENPRLKTAAGEAREDGETDAGLYLDLREDRLLVFFDRLESETTYTYSLRAVTRGRFVLPPLAADAMYAPGFSAVTPAGVLVVE